MSQFGVGLYSLWKAKFNGKKKWLCASRKFKNVFSKNFIIYGHIMNGPSPLTSIIKVTNINPGGVTVSCVILTLYQLSDTVLGLMCT
jgi:hypothetical protein